MKASLALTVVCTLTAVSHADIEGLALGTSPPPGQLGIWTMLAAPFDGRLFSDVTSVPGQIFTTITFSQPMSCRQVGFGWATWSHGYTGNVYYTNSATTITLGVLGERLHRGAFSLYAEPNPFGVFTMIATGSDGVSAVTFTEGVDGSGGAKGWAFYTTSEPWGIDSVTITSDVDFAVGEFATGYIPAPGGLALAGFIALRPARRRIAT
ncbi:MAG: hypothetical protein IT436_16265 [Phycisphaerales bacterium]|nr:hypothetical protein [Phycisphaerales bacterium]